MKRLILISFVVMCLCAVSAKADLITIKISGQVTSFADPGGHFENKINVLMPFNGTYTYDSSTPDSNPSDVQQGAYEYATSPFGMWVNIGGLTFGTNPANVHFSVGIANDLGEYPSDAYVVDTSALLPLPDGTKVNQMFWQLDDDTATALSSDALPVTAPVLSDWNPGNNFSIMCDPYADPSNMFGIVGQITSAEVVPEPVSVALLSLGALFLRRRKG